MTFHRPGATGPTRLLEAKGLTLRFGAIPALIDVDIDITAGEVVAIVGESGSGKTTLLRVLSGMMAPDAGTVLWRGQDVLAMGEAARRRRLAQIVLGDHLRRRIACRREHQQRGLRNCCAAGKSGRKAKRQARHRKGNLHRHGYPVEVQDRGRSDRSKCKRTLGPGAARNACAK